MLYAVKEGERIPATPKQRALCPGCGQPVIAKCGEINVWHWAHQVSDCDAWSEGETDWHLEWKGRFKQVEVTIRRDGEWHRADAMTDGGWVIEFQHSPISPEQMQTREKFYGDMVWIFDATKARDADMYGEMRLTLYREHDTRAKDGYVTFRWKHPRKCLAFSSKQVYLDLGKGWLLKMGKIYTEGVCGGWGYLVPYREFLGIDA